MSEGGGLAGWLLFCGFCLNFLKFTLCIKVFFWLEWFKFRWFEGEIKGIQFNNNDVRFSISVVYSFKTA